MNCTNIQKIPLEQPLKELFKLFEDCAFEYFKQTIPTISKTIFDSDYYLEISDEQHFLKLSCENTNNSAEQAFMAIIELDYTAKDLKPLKGKIINKRTFLGLIEKLYLIENKWYYLNPQEFAQSLNPKELELNAEIIKSKILAGIFQG